MKSMINIASQHHSDQASMMAFAPIVHEIGPVLTVRNAKDIDTMARGLASTSTPDMVGYITNSLEPVWLTLEKIMADLPAVYKRYDWSAASLRALYSHVGDIGRVMQFQMPAILPADASPEEIEAAMTPLLQSHGLNSEVIEANYGMQRRAKMTFDSDGDSDFGFWTISQSNPDEAHSSRLFALPLITIHSKFLKAVKNTQSDLLLRDFQFIFGLINHDWYHALTPAVVRPYVSKKGFDIRHTGFGLLYRHNTRGQAYNRGSLYMDFLNGLIGPSPEFRFARSGDNYEGMGMHAQAAVFQELHKNPDMKVLLETHLDRYFMTLGGMGRRLRKRGEKHLASQSQMYFANLMVQHLLRVVPVDHAVIRHCERLIAAHLRMDKRYLVQETFKRVLNERADDVSKVSRMSGVTLTPPANDTAGRGNSRSSFSEAVQQWRDVARYAIVQRPRLHRQVRRMTPADHVAVAACHETFNGHAEAHSAEGLQDRAKLPLTLHLMMDAIWGDVSYIQRAQHHHGGHHTRAEHNIA